MRFVSIELYNLLKIDFTFCQILQFLNIIQTNGWMDGYTNDHRPTDRWTNGWKMFLSHTDAIDASEKDDFPTDFSI